MKVNFNKIPLAGREVEYIKEAIASGHLQGDGEFLKKCEAALRAATKAKAALLTTSCTSALDMAALLCDIKPGDEVIVPTFTFVSSVNAFVLRGAKPVFCDIRPDTLNIDESQIPQLLTKRTKAVVPVHYAGVGCEMDTIMETAKSAGIRVVEDAAQGFCADYKGRHLGTIGDLGALSFHSTKNVIAGECGALLCNDESLIDRACFIREKGTNRIQFVEGKIDKYTWIDYGSSYIPSELITAFLAAQLEAAQKLTDERVAAWNYYRERLLPLERAGKISLAHVPAECKHNAHIFFILTESPETAKSLAAFLKSREISALSHYAPLHTCPMAKKLGCEYKPLPVAEKLSQTMLRLPIYSAITPDEQDWVVDSVEAFFAK